MSIDRILLTLRIPPWWLLLCTYALAVMMWRRWRSSTDKSLLPLPPGPPALPVIGNLLDVPTSDMEIHFRDMNAKYGIVSPQYLHSW